MAEAGDSFGRALASTKRFEGEPPWPFFDDLVIGIPFEDVGSIKDTGAINVVYGSPSGLSEAATPDHNGLWPTFWHQDSPGIPDVAEPFDMFGYSLTTGDFDHVDPHSEVVIGVPFEDVGTAVNAGAVDVLSGSVLSGSPWGTHQFWHQDSTDIEGVAEPGDLFGWSLAVGIFNDDQFADLAIGVPSEDVGKNPNAGAVNVIYGAASDGRNPGGLSSKFNQFWHQDSLNIEDTAEPSDHFGYSLATGNFDSHVRDDLAIGVPYEDVGGIVDAGAVNVIYSRDWGLDSLENQIANTPDQFWHQNITNVEDLAEAGDLFGFSLSSGAFKSWMVDLAIGVRFEDLSSLSGSLVDAGGVAVIYGSEFNSLFGGLNATLTPDQFWTQDYVEILPSQQ